MYLHLVNQLNLLAQYAERVDRQAQILELCDSDDPKVKELGRDINTLTITIDHILSRQA